MLHSLLHYLLHLFFKFCCISPWSFVSKYSNTYYILIYLSFILNKELLSHLKMYRKSTATAQTDGRIAMDGPLDTGPHSPHSLHSPNSHSGSLHSQPHSPHSLPDPLHSHSYSLHSQLHSRIPLIPFSDSPFWLLQIAVESLP